MNILMIGDIVGRPGRRVVRQLLPSIQQEYDIGFTLANGENAAGGRGITQEIAQELLALGIDVITMGNHVWDNKEIFNFIDGEARLLRPANYPGDCPGIGYNVYLGPQGYRIAVINVSGRVFLGNLDCPFRTIDYILRMLKDEADVVLVDFHAEATSEKQAYAYYLDGRVTAVFGTHTHVQTADETILPNGTAYITDVGMCGPRYSVLGVRKEQVIEKFLTQRPIHFEVAKGPMQLDAVVLKLDESLKAREIKRLKYFVEA